MLMQDTNMKLEDFAIKAEVIIKGINHEISFMTGKDLSAFIPDWAIKGVSVKGLNAMKTLELANVASMHFLKAATWRCHQVICLL